MTNLVRILMRKTLFPVGTFVLVWIGLSCDALAATVRGAPKSDDDRMGGWAMTATGKIIASAQNKKAPWLEDVVKTVPVEYPESERMRRHQGSGMFHLWINVKTGSVTNIMVKRSTGFALFDDSIIRSFRQWRWRPGTWKEIEFPVIFELTHDGSRGTQVGSVPIPSTR